MNKRAVYLWAIMLSIALLCNQSVQFHTHSLDHGHEQQHSHIPVEGAVEHSHLTKVHPSIDISHADHHDEVASEIDASPNALLKNISSKVLTLALLVTILALFLPGFYQYTFNRLRNNDAPFPWRHHLSPPLRAPPV